MAKRVLKLKFRIPPYIHPRNKWRKSIHAEAIKANVQYLPGDRLDVIVRLYLGSHTLHFHDVDNRLKDILDALQGRMGGSKKIRPHGAIIPNDKQVYRAIIEKMAPPRQSHGLGHVIVRKYKPRNPLTH